LRAKTDPTKKITLSNGKPAYLIAKPSYSDEPTIVSDVVDTAITDVLKPSLPNTDDKMALWKGWGKDRDYLYKDIVYKNADGTDGTNPQYDTPVVSHVSITMK